MLVTEVQENFYSGLPDPTNHTKGSEMHQENSGKVKM